MKVEKAVVIQQPYLLPFWMKYQLLSPTKIIITTQSLQVLSIRGEDMKVLIQCQEDPVWIKIQQWDFMTKMI